MKSGTNLRCALTGIVLSLVFAQPLNAQSAGSIHLRAPGAEIAGSFAHLSGIRELTHDEALVVDRLERAVFIVDWRSGARRMLGRVGAGPGEYLLPIGLVPTGDSTLVIDAAARSVHVIHPNGTFSNRVDPFVGLRGFALAQRPNLNASDNAGRLYGTSPPIRRLADGKVVATDSAPIVRWNLGENSWDTVAYLPLTPDPSRVATAAGISSRPKASAFQSENDWAVSSAGDIWIVRAHPYIVERLGANGRVLQRTELPYDPVPVTDAHKAAFIRAANRPQDIVLFKDGMVTGVSRIAPTQPQSWVFPKVLPPFQRESVKASENHLWIKRAGLEGSPVQYDVVDRAGNRHRVELPARSFIIGFGAGSAFVVRADDDDLHYLQRFELPTSIR